PARRDREALALSGMADDRAIERGRLIAHLRRVVTDERVLEAIRAVPRERFVPPPLQRYAYEDQALRIGHDQTISQPTIVATMTEALHLRDGDRVLDIGTGSGYQAAI